MAEVIQKKRFTETKRYLNNPHRGCCTFQHFNGDPLFEGTSWSEQGPLTFSEPIDTVVKGYLPCSVSYCRWFWDVMEPKEGEYNFDFIEKSLEICKQRGQKLVVRLMPFGSSKQPQIPDWYKKKYPVVIDTPKSGINQTIPDPESPEYLLKWGELLRAFATKFDANPLLEGIDLAYIGPWGEGAGRASVQTNKNFVEVYGAAFKNTLLISQLDTRTFEHAKKYNAGWRVDCFGDLKHGGSDTFSREQTTCHMFDSYPKSVVKANAQNTWQTAPVFMETCSVPMNWYWGGGNKFKDVSYDIDFIIQQGYKYHTTYFMPKYTYLPDAWIEKLSDFCDKIGYRYIYRQVVFDRKAKIGSEFNFTSWIENTGVAPIYVKYDFAIRLRQDDEEEIIILNQHDIRNWLPGDVWLDEKVKIPSKFKPGPLEISAGIIDRDKKPAVLFAVDETFKDGWLGFGNIYIS
jgi:hypothetical protein